MAKLRITRLVARLSEDDQILADGEPITYHFIGFASMFRRVTSTHRGTDLKDWALITEQGTILPFDVISVAHGIPSPVPLVE